MEVILRPVGKDAWSGKTRYKNCAIYLGSYYTRTGVLYNGLDMEDLKEKLEPGTTARRLEKALGYAEGTFGINGKDGKNFWETFFIKVTGEKDVILETSIPQDELKYIFLKHHKRISEGVGKTAPGIEFVLINKDSEAVEVNKLNKIKRDAIVEFGKLSLNDMRKCLRIYGYKADAMSNDLVEAKLYELVEADPSKFFTKWVGNKVKNLEFLIEEAISKNIIRRNKNVYYYGTEIIGHSMDDTIAYLDSPKNQDLKLAIQKETESKN